MEITWEVCDGYDGKSCPQTTQIDDSEFEDCTTPEEVQEIVDEAIQADYDQLQWEITDGTEMEEMQEKVKEKNGN